MQNRTRSTIALLFALATLAAIAYTVHLSLGPQHYFFRNPEDRASWLHEPSNVALVCGVMLIEAAVACLAMVATRPKQLWARCLIGLLLLGPWALFSTMLVVHVPGYILFHHLWVWLLVLVLTISLSGSIIRQLYFRIRKDRLGNA